MSVHRIAISANFTIEPIARSAKAFLNKLGIDNEIVFAPYNQVFQQLVDPSSLFHGNTEGANVIFLRVEDLIDGKAIDYKYGTADLERIKTNAANLSVCLENATRFHVPLFIFLCPHSPEPTLDSAFKNGLYRVEDLFFEEAENLQNVFISRTEHIRDRYELETISNPKGNYLGHLPYTDEFFSVLGIELVRKIDGHLREPFKVLVLDCDNTLWDGVCGEEGADGIGFSDERIHLQQLAADLSAKGLLVCLCSKNNEADVWEVFDRRSEMKLKREHLVSWKINWLPKSANLRALAAELQLGLDSFIFIDDDPVVCSEVKTNCPEVLTLQIPASVAELSRFLEHTWVFDKAKVTREDIDRTQSYQRQTERNRLRSETPDLASFLESLQLSCEVSEMLHEDIPRVSQLSMRTNQFNSTTMRFSETDVRTLADEGRKNFLTVRVKDRFGDYGLVGVVIWEESDESLDVVSFMLSCRVLGRGVEHTIIRYLAKKASDLDKASIRIEYSSSAKNAPFLNFLTEICGAPTIVGAETRPYSLSIGRAENIIPQEGVQENVSSKPEKSANSANPLMNGVRHTAYIEIAKELSESKWFEPTVSNVLRSELSNEYVEAETVTELELKKIWEKVLSLKNIGVTDDFFELGGDSLVAVSLFVEIENRFSSSLSLSALLGAPTISKLAEIVGQDSQAKGWQYLVPIQDQGGRPPLFCIHAAGGNVLFYRDLANELGPQQPVYGLQARGVANKKETAHDRVEDMAHDYLCEIRELQPNGPYRLCGSSFGGLVAFEAARQLRQSGEDIEILALFDTYAPGYIQENSVKVSSNRIDKIVGRAKNVGAQLRAIGTVRDRIHFILGKLVKLKMQVKRTFLWKKNDFAAKYNKATGKELPIDIRRNHKAIDKALNSYKPGLYEGGAILFRATDQPKDIVFDRALGWEKYVYGEITAIDVAGTHGALTVSPFARDLAEKFGPFLERKNSEVSEARTLIRNFASA